MWQIGQVYPHETISGPAGSTWHGKESRQIADLFEFDPNRVLQPDERNTECRPVFSRLDAPTLDEAAEHFAASDYPPDNTMAVELRRIAGKIRSMEEKSKDQEKDQG